MTGTVKNISYLIIGDGKLATHLSYYFQSQNIIIKNWNRREFDREDLKKKFTQCPISLLCISDYSITNFLQENAFLLEKPAVHFSGSLQFDNVINFHPLMSFTSKMYALDFYKKIPFIGVDENIQFKDIFPSLENPIFYIKKEQKAFYHSLCVLSNNFTSILWKKVYSEFQKTLHLPTEALRPYLMKTFENIAQDPKASMTGPLVRGDFEVIQKNIDSLRNDNFLKVYKSFVEIMNPSFKEKDLQ